MMKWCSCILKQQNILKFLNLTCKVLEEKKPQQQNKQTKTALSISFFKYYVQKNQVMAKKFHTSEKWGKEK